MDYRLRIDGDASEKEGWDLFVQNRFSNYELFWKEFVVPITNRPKAITFKENTVSEKKELSSLHYTIFTHLL